jgi:hypothetical protein
LRHGQRVLPSTPAGTARISQLDDGTVVGAHCDSHVVALARVENGGLRPLRVINC